MAQSQSSLQTMLEEVEGPEAVYMQPPTVMKFPCIKYERDSSKVVHADDIKYMFMKRYQITVIDRDPDSPIPDRVENLEHCAFVRWFIKDGLNHWVYSLYF